MGFFVMVFSMLLGILFVVMGFSLRKKSKWFKIVIIPGTVLISFAVYLALPK